MPECFVFFDGDCPACNCFIRWIAAADRDGHLAFAALQSPLGQQLLRALGWPADYGDSILVISAQGVLTHAQAFAALGRVTRFPGTVLRFAAWLPRRVFAAAYGWLGRRRRRLPVTVCPVLPADLATRFELGPDALRCLWRWTGVSRQ